MTNERQVAERNGSTGRHWADHADRYEQMGSGFADHLFAVAAIAETEVSRHRLRHRLDQSGRVQPAATANDFDGERTAVAAEVPGRRWHLVAGPGT